MDCPPEPQARGRGAVTPPRRGAGGSGCWWWVRGLLLLGLFAGYPVALVIPMGLGFRLAFHIGLPWFQVLTLTAAGYLAVTPVCGGARRCLRWAFAAAIWGAAALHLAAALAGGTADLFRVTETAGMVILPAFFAAVPGRALPRRLDMVLFALWAVQLVHCGMQALAGHEPVALAGNRNWAATLVALLTPWACWALRRVRPAPARRLLQGAAAGLSLWVVYACHCRATWLALALYAVVFGVLRPLRPAGRVLVAAALLAGAFGLLVSHPDKAAKWIAEDIRLPLYASSLRLWRDHPLLGVGPGNFAREFVAYRSAAQKSRAVSAAVTDHPHCEALNAALAAGPAALLLWALALAVPLFLRAGRSPARCLAHAALWLLVVHGLLDKVLVQPPTSVLAVLFAGVLWRPHLRLRADPDCRRGALRAARVPAAAVVSALALYVAGRELIQGVLFRRAYLAEAAGRRMEAAGAVEEARAQYRRAYEAYAQSTRVAPRNVRTHAYAGICANSTLRDPELALPHLRRAMELERDFAHLNAEAGLALGALGRHEEAFPFFLREARLFPFDIEPQRHLLVCALATGRTGLLEPVHGRLLDNCVRKVWQALGEDTAGALTLSLRDALARGNPTEALAAANALLRPLDPQPVEAPFTAAVGESLTEALRTAPFGVLDYRWWRELEETRHQWVAELCADPAELLRWLRAAGLTREELWGRLPDAARLAGFSPACLEHSAPGFGRRFVGLRRGKEHWLLDLDLGEAVPGASLAGLLTRPDLAGGRGVRAEEMRGAAVRVPAHPLQFLARTQVLGALVRKGADGGGVPLPFSPVVEAAVLQAALAGELQGAGLPPESLAVRLDEGPLAAFREALERNLREAAEGRSGGRGP